MDSPAKIDVSTKAESAPRRRAGICLHVTALPGQYGIGEIGNEAHAFVDRLAEMGVGVWQFLPLGPTAYGDSPYQPLSTFAGNEMLIDVADLSRRGLLRNRETESLSNLPAGQVDYGSLIPQKIALLNMAASRFAARADSADKADFDRFLDENDRLWLADYALFRILKSRHGQRAWPEWAPEYVHRESAAIRAAVDRFGHEIETIKVLQFLFHHQWQRLRDHARARDVKLFGDLPIYIALDSADAWTNREIVRLDPDGKPGQVAGVPPDYFSEDGQLWGNPVYDWHYHAETGYRWWIERLRRAVDQADLVRIDHFRGFESYWTVPADARTARAGTWEPGPGSAIFDAVQQALGELPIVAEDLGVITDEVNALRDRHGIPGMSVLQFDVIEPDFDPSAIEANRVCYTGTHDNDTTLGWFRGSPGDIRTETEIESTRRAALAVTGGTAETIHHDMIRLAMSTRARLAIAPLQDYLGLGSEARFNTPGTSSNNWRWRVTEAQLDPEFCDTVAGLVDEAGRADAAR